MKRIIMMVLRNLFAVPVLWIRLCYHAAHVDKYTDEQHYKLLKDIVRHANRGGNVIVKGYGIENIPEKDGFMFFPNHQGMYDILAMINVSPRPFSMVGKIELKDIPLLKQVLKCMKGFLLDRDDIRQGMKVILSVAEEVKNGRNYCIFPEGTRSKNGNIPGEFKGGSFKAATKAKSPIVPVALIDCFKPFDTNTIAPVTVQVHFLKPMYYEEYKGMKTVEIAAEVKKRIEKVIQENEKFVDKRDYV